MKQQFDPKNLVSQDEANQISWSDAVPGETSIEGFYKGLQPILNEKQELMYILYLENDKGLTSCPASYKILEFLKMYRFKTDHYLKITLKEKIQTKGKQPLNVFSFAYDPAGVGISENENQFMTVDELEIEVQSNVQKAKELIASGKKPNEKKDLKFVDEKTEK